MISRQQDCPYCSNSDLVKAGRNPSGSQIYKCRACCRKFTPEPNPHGYSESLRHHALRLYRKGQSFRAVSTELNVSHQTVANWINQVELG